MFGTPQMKRVVSRLHPSPPNFSMIRRFLLILQGRRVHKDEDDKVIWTVSKNDKFFVEALYLGLELESPTSFLVCVIWTSWMLPKVGVFAWLATWNKLSTLDHLQRRGWSLTNRCFLCHLEEESIDHILIHLIKTRDL